ncbi:MAG: hypothetical protein V3V08_09070 [Nannocystaceae bacterium]
MTSRTHSLLLLSALLLAPACGASSSPAAPAKPLAQKAKTLKIEQPKTLVAQNFTIKSRSTRVEFTMNAPVEKIRGKIPKEATTGELKIDLTDITKSTGLLHIDLTQLELFQRKSENGMFGEEVKNDTQNAHARTWLEIDESTPAIERKQNALVEFALRRVPTASHKNVLAMTGQERKITFEAQGDFLLHQRKSPKTVKLEATFRFDGDTPVSVHVRSIEPFAVDLAEHDVRPRTAFGKLAQKTLSAMSEKVAQVAEISVDFTADHRGPIVATN